MAGTGWNSPDLLARFNQLAGRPAVDAITDQVKYRILADAEQTVLTKIEGIVPNVLYGPPTQLVTNDNGYTFQFGLDGDGYPLFASGKAGVYPSLNAIPDYPWLPGVDYLDEGIQIRMPNNQQYSGPLFWYGITPPQELSDTVQPILQPPASRILIVIEAVRSFAESYDRNPGLAAAMRNRWDREFGSWMTAIRRHFRGNGDQYRAGWRTRGGWFGGAMRGSGWW